MNKEEKLNQRIEWLKEEINIINRMYDTANDDDLDHEKMEFYSKMFKRELKFLQITPRTIETLKIGDYIEFEFDNNSIPGSYKGFIYNTRTIDMAKNDYKNGDIVEYKIIPHEYLEMWGDLWKQS